MPSNERKASQTSRTRRTRRASHKRTGLRKPQQHLKAWADREWSRALTPRLSVAMVDEELPVGMEGGRKSWYIALTQHHDVLTEVGPVHGLSGSGKMMLLFEDDIVALVQYLVDVHLVDMDDDGLIFNTEAEKDETDLP
jgi:hypothetical protein